MEAVSKLSSRPPHAWSCRGSHFCDHGFAVCSSALVRGDPTCAETHIWRTAMLHGPILLKLRRTHRDWVGCSWNVIGVKAFTAKLTNQVAPERATDHAGRSAVHHSATPLANQQILWFVDNLGGDDQLPDQKTSGTLRQCRLHWPLSCRHKFWNEWVDTASNPSDGLSRVGADCPPLQAEWLASSRDRARLGFLCKSQYGRVSLPT